MTIGSSEEFLDFLKRAHDEFQPLAEKLKFDKSHPWHRNSIALYGSILELTGSSILLVENRLLSGVPVLMRTILEAYVDLTNLINDKSYGYVLELSYLKEWLKLLNEAQKGNNQYLASISEASDLNQNIAKWQAEISTLESSGHQTLKKYEKFKLADMEDEYRSTYNTLCGDSHNNIKALINRHMEIDQEDFNMVIYKDYSPEDSAIYVGTGAEILVRATEKIHSFLSSDCMSIVNAYRSELNILRGDSDTHNQ